MSLHLLRSGAPARRADINNELLSILVRAPLLFCITALRHHRVRNWNLLFRLTPRIAGITLITDRGCYSPQANSTILSAKIRIGPSPCAGLFSIHLRSPIEFIPIPFGSGCPKDESNGRNRAPAAQHVR